MADNGICGVEGCGKPAKVRSQCSTHYNKWLLSPEGLAAKGVANGTLPEWLRNHVGWVGDECLIWPFARMPKGYPCVLRLDGIKTYAHRHMCRLRHGPPPQNGMDAAHSCGRGHDGCVNPNHLRWATRKSNMDDSVRLGTLSRGSSRYNSILSEQDVRTIRNLLGSLQQKEIAAQLGVRPQCVQAVAARKTWAWLE